MSQLMNVKLGFLAERFPAEITKMTLETQMTVDVGLERATLSEPPITNFTSEKQNPQHYNSYIYMYK